MADVGIQLLDQLPLLSLWQGKRPLQQFTLQQPRRIPDLGIGKASELQSSCVDEGEKALEVVTGLLRMQIHIGEIGVRGAVHGPAFPVVARQTIALGQNFEQLPTETKTVRTGARFQQAQNPLGCLLYTSPSPRDY